MSREELERLAEWCENVAKAAGECARFWQQVAVRTQAAADQFGAECRDRLGPFSEN
jgi:hypothetical protein